MRLKTFFLSSLEKVFANRNARPNQYTQATALRGEVFSFQLAVCNVTYDPMADEGADELSVGSSVVLEVGCKSKLPVEIRQVESVPVSHPTSLLMGNVLGTEPGLYPDLLSPLEPGNCIRIVPRQWGSLWVTVRIPAKCKPGEYPIKLTLSNIGSNRLHECKPETVERTFSLTVKSPALPPQELLRFEWLHADCLHTYYKVPCWSSAHWKILENFIANGAAHGLNVLYTPLWTPPLDTVPGGERPTTQLLKIRKEKTRYIFDFSRLERFVKLGEKYGMKRYSISHAFTQWGAKATPKIMAEVNGKEKRIFGWDVPADSPEYRNFLSQLIPELLKFFQERGLKEKLQFSVSDEPNLDVIDSYAKASAILNEFIEGAPIVDALSHVDFFERGILKHPVPSISALDDFYGKVKELYTYFFCGNEFNTPNRFIAMPSARTRIVGVLFYLYDIKLFLHWGFNFYFTQYSLAPCDPYRETCGGKWVPGGDPFIVYPGEDGHALDSLRHEVFYEALQDQRALSALEKKIGRKAVVELIQQGIPYKITVNNHPQNPEYLLALRETVNTRLAK